jgi:hypothetical protein
MPAFLVVVAYARHSVFKLTAYQYGTKDSPFVPLPFCHDRVSSRTIKIPYLVKCIGLNYILSVISNTRNV